MKFDINKVVVKDLNNQKMKVEDLHKGLGNFIYNKTATLDWVGKATAIHSGEEVELTDKERETLISLIESPICDFVIAVKVALIDHLKKLK